MEKILKIKELIVAIIILIIVALSINKTVAQENRIYIAGAIDTKMAIEGPHNRGGTLNPELSIGFIIHNQARVWTGYEWLQQISYQKYTVIAADYIVNVNERLNVKIGPEFSVIYRHMDRGIYTGYDDDNWSVGINGEIEYKILSNFSVFINSNGFIAEPFDNLGNPMKKYRWDVRTGIIIYLFNL